MRGYRQLSASLDQVDPQHRLDVLTYRDFLPSLSFYRGELTASAYGMERDTRFQENDSYRTWYLPTAKDLQRFLAARPEVLLVVREHSLDDFEQETGYSCRRIYRQRKHSAFVCHRPGIDSDKEPD